MKEGGWFGGRVRGEVGCRWKVGVGRLVGSLMGVDFIKDVYG